MRVGLNPPFFAPLSLSSTTFSADKAILSVVHASQGAIAQQILKRK
jgi:hypothetical protein